MLSADAKGQLLKDEFHVQVFSDGKVDWDRLDVFLRRNQEARRQLAAHLEPLTSRPRPSSSSK